jgi:hypothetical protein
MKKLLFAAAFAVALQNATGAMADGYGRGFWKASRRAGYNPGRVANYDVG